MARFVLAKICFPSTHSSKILSSLSCLSSHHLLHLLKSLSQIHLLSLSSDISLSFSPSPSFPLPLRFHRCAASELHRQQLFIFSPSQISNLLSPLISTDSNSFCLSNSACKVRLQMNPNLRRGAIGEMRKIASEEGITALWKGVGPAMARAASLTASQFATYDESKRVLIRWTPLEEGFYLHLMTMEICTKL